MGSGGTVEVIYSKGGKPVILVPDDILEGSGLCGAGQVGAGDASNSNGDGRRLNASTVSARTIFLPILVLLFICS